MSTASSEKRPMSRPALTMVSFAWLVLVALEYFWIPVFRVSELFAWLAITAAWLWVISRSTAVVLTYLSLRDYGRCVAALSLALGAGAVARTADWEALYAEGLVWSHRDAFAELAADHEHHRPLTVPGWMGYLSIDGQVWPQRDVLYLPVFEDWRAESGRGIAYIPGSDGRGTTVHTASGDLGSATYDLGGGWWWVE
ncbi:hypothetical protein OG339_42805 [Streptosporangium sp. NBC_01495]|uniref:hypothetical protein n=1 Tax=Streptosporangium sp. NBC_01495 TaxID=2903899 RepID=UPI002E3722FD|nr:hypothetical protein [Streptosporangium sp. NBC_01495]